MLVMLDNTHIGVSIRCKQSGKGSRLLTYMFFYVYVLEPLVTFHLLLPTHLAIEGTPTLKVIHTP